MEVHNDGSFTLTPKDGESFAENVESRLRETAADIQVRRDRHEIQGGESWWRAIQASIGSRGSKLAGR